MNMQGCIVFFLPPHLTAICLHVFDAHHMSTLLFKMPAHTRGVRLSLPHSHTGLIYGINFNACTSLT